MNIIKLIGRRKSIVKELKNEDKKDEWKQLLESYDSLDFFIGLKGINFFGRYFILFSFLCKVIQSYKIYQFYI